MNKKRKLLLNWYKKNNFQMPWRNTQDPYKIWISEIMLQQTQVSTVIPYYEKWIKKFPTIQKLASTNIDVILKQWEGLGYYQRAHNIYYTSQHIVENNNGIIPNQYMDLIELKGIGDYTASAILSIAFKKPYPAIDGNLKRIIARLYAVKNTDIIKFSKNKVSSYMSKKNAGEINQALMDLGREVCRPKRPNCQECPLSKQCIAFNLNQVEKYPKKTPNKTIPSYNVVVGLIHKNNKFLISKRKKNGLLGGLWELPGGKKKYNESDYDCLNREVKEELDISIDIDCKIGTIKHQYSHFKINLIGYKCNYKKGTPKPLESEEIKWIKNINIDNFAFPKSTSKFLTLAGYKK